MRSSQSSTCGLIASPLAGSSWSINTLLTAARTPESLTPRATSGPNQYMSKKRVVPDRIISRQARRVPQ
jgi:hypothetical protein